MKKYFLNWRADNVKYAAKKTDDGNKSVIFPQQKNREKTLTNGSNGIDGAVCDTHDLCDRRFIPCDVVDAVTACRTWYVMDVFPYNGGSSHSPGTVRKRFQHVLKPLSGKRQRPAALPADTGQIHTVHPSDGCLPYGTYVQHDRIHTGNHNILNKYRHNSCGRRRPDNICAAFKRFRVRTRLRARMGRSKSIVKAAKQEPRDGSAVAGIYWRVLRPVFQSE